MSWCFAIINNRIAEIYFEKNKKEVKFLGHCYVKESEYTLKEERDCIKKDIVKHRFTYRKGVYKNRITKDLYFIGQL